MLKYVDALVSFQEVPDEISLCINISNCPCHCEGCHSSYLAENIGEELTIEVLHNLIRQNHGITCVCLMGGDSNPGYINKLAFSLKLISWYRIKVAWYSGRQYIPDEIQISNFDYIKIGPYIEKLGGLTSPNTNQIMYQNIDGRLVEITSKFWRNAVESSL